MDTIKNKLNKNQVELINDYSSCVEKKSNDSEHIVPKVLLNLML